MELTLTQTSQKTIAVICDSQSSHTFLFDGLLPIDQDKKIVLTNPVETGKRLFDALFREGTLARAAWNQRPKRLLLVAEDAELDAIPWEYLYGPDGFIVLDVAFARGLPAVQRQPTPNLAGTPMHIVAVPSNPIDHDIQRLDISGEWMRLKDNLSELETALTLERVRPPTLEQARRLVANQRNRVLHFMGHGGHTGADSFLVFEDERGAPKSVTAQEFIRRLEDTTFLVTLNACASATPGETEFSNLAHALAQKGVPYALGMRFSIPDDDAKVFSRTFYDELARGSSVENALRQARNSLTESKNIWAIGTPVLYTSLSEAARGFETLTGKPRIDEYQPRLEVFALPRAEGAFQGRVDELLAIGQVLTGEPRPKLLTIHGAGGQGKTALAREAAERFAHAWLGGVWAISLENNVTLDKFTFELARLFKLDLDGIYKKVTNGSPNLESDVFQERIQQELERRILAILNNQRTLLVLDNAETFVEAVDVKDKAAVALAVFLREKVLSTQASLLLTSRMHLGWTGEQVLELAGLSPDEGARLFWQSAPGRGLNAIGPLAQNVSRKVEGHPLSLRLLGGGFDASKISLDEFVDEVENTLLQAKDKYKHEDHRHRTLFASIETSVRYLDNTQKILLSELWIFNSPFLPETARQIFTLPNLSKAEIELIQEQIPECLDTLFRRGLLEREEQNLTDYKFRLYRVLPTIRLFAQYYIEQGLPTDVLQIRSANTHYALIQNISRHIKQSAWYSTLAVRCRADFEICVNWVSESERGWYANYLGWVLQCIGNRWEGIRYLEIALEMEQGKDLDLKLDATNSLANIYSSTGNSNKALELYQQALSLQIAVGDLDGAATTLNNTGLVYKFNGKPDKAIKLYQDALVTHREFGNRAGEATTLNNMAVLCNDSGKLDDAMKFYQQALPITREVGDRSLENTILNNIAGLYRATGNPGKALEFYQQALSFRREVGNREAEATTLNNIALINNDMGKSGDALNLYQQALDIHRQVNNRVMEATTLSNMALVHSATGNPDLALKLLQQAMPIVREVNHRVGEATILINMARVYSTKGNPIRALELLEKALPIAREAGIHPEEATILSNIAVLYFSNLSRPQEAIQAMEQATNVFQSFGLLHDASGATLYQAQAALAMMKYIANFEND